MRQFLTLAKALSDENRVRALLALRAGEVCVCQIIEMLGLAPSTVSKHMAILAQADLIECRKEGRWHYYRLTAIGASPAVRATHKWMQSLLAGSPAAARDAKRLAAICRRMAREAARCRGN